VEPRFLAPPRTGKPLGALGGAPDEELLHFVPFGGAVAGAGFGALPNEL